MKTFTFNIIDSFLINAFCTFITAYFHESRISRQNFILNFEKKFGFVNFVGVIPDAPQKPKWLKLPVLPTREIPELKSGGLILPIDSQWETPTIVVK